MGVTVRQKGKRRKKDLFTPEQWEIIHSLHKEIKGMGQALFVVNRCQSVLEGVLLRKGVVTAKELVEWA